MPVMVTSGLFFDQQDRVRHRVQLGPVVLQVGEDLVAVAQELEPCRAGLGPDLHRLGSRGHRVEPIVGDEFGKDGSRQGLLRAALAAVYAAVDLLAQFDVSVEHPAFIGGRCAVVVALFLAVAAADDHLRRFVVVGRELHALEALGPEVDAVARAAVDHDRREGGLAASVLGDEHGGQGHRVLRPDPEPAHVHLHRELYLTVLLDHLPAANPDLGEVADLVLGVCRSRAARQHR